MLNRLINGDLKIANDCYKCKPYTVAHWPQNYGILVRGLAVTSFDERKDCREILILYRKSNYYVCLVEQLMLWKMSLANSINNHERNIISLFCLLVYYQRVFMAWKSKMWGSCPIMIFFCIINFRECKKFWNVFSKTMMWTCRDKFSSSLNNLILVSYIFFCGTVVIRRLCQKILIKT